MDRTELSEAIIQEVSAMVAEELRAAGPELLTADLDGMETRLQAVSRRVCGATMERVLAVRAAPQGGMRQNSESVVVGSQRVGYPSPFIGVR